MTSDNRNRVLFIVGPTASGKTTLSIKLAKRLNGEIVSADSRQLYRFMNIGTATPTTDEMDGVVHHCIDIRNPDDFFSAGSYSNLAREIIDEIHRRNRPTIVVGGSGLYIQGLVDGIFSGKHRDTGIRSQLKNQADAEGLNTLYDELLHVDPAASEKIHPNDAKRIIRALEVYRITGEPISKVQKEQTVQAGFTPLFFGLEWPRDILYERIDKRVEIMIEEGLVKEVKSLLARGFSLNDNAMDSVGYKEIIAHLKGDFSLDEAVSLIKRNTRRFAKRQMTWFRRDNRIQWIPVNLPVDWDSIADSIIIDFKRSL